uniref:Uncharacterized protein n=1 Tax=Eucampia antarctica TaxID=49252 RepID=A0A7S2R370_9STRA|mmetsp:Transcript_13848/g.13429  ORF Transcript_13848/g.13429 Transcript_13848/m.13429 type:complete len:249 (+) Transcript_13848:80-826(+)|eukprot:CAMPEP_0197833200 /NCGR_PEP_ID=MMETSP1437-20131217/18171_1 /TAXON_ID=49252 ORGANISM="Eucampia antarctica, Strain CCMP1452" /NCGR_SAMPLE_ID=MMETSP1437 /ASSEMBLY_ACC=CAM_ASM_001096 /LENGTH=248 /DNA_ID=CAMNT_0043437107 /DNA_START=80 /DNA_END=826 /DNA_ORIENTATION=+
MSIRSLLSSCSRVSAIVPTKDKLLGTERIFLECSRLILRDTYKKQLASCDFDVVATSVDTSISFLDKHEFWEDMSRDNDISYYKIGKGKKGVDPVSGEEYAFETQGNGFKYCIPRILVSLGEKREFSGLLLQKALAELKHAKEETVNSNAALIGATIYMDEGSHGVESFENQFRQAAQGSPDVFCVEGCHDKDKVQRLKEFLLRNERKMVTLSKPNTTGHMIPEHQQTEIGFDIPALLMREGQIDEIL